MSGGGQALGATSGPVQAELLVALGFGPLGSRPCSSPLASPPPSPPAVQPHSKPPWSPSHQVETTPQGKKTQPLIQEPLPLHSLRFSLPRQCVTCFCCSSKEGCRQLPASHDATRVGSWARPHGSLSTQKCCLWPHTQTMRPLRVPFQSLWAWGLP